MATTTDPAILTPEDANRSEEVDRSFIISIEDRDDEEQEENTLEVLPSSPKG